MPDAEWVDIVVADQVTPFLLWPAGSDYEVKAADVTELNISNCLSTLHRYSEQLSWLPEKNKPARIDLFVILDDELFPWEKNLFGIAIHLGDDNEYLAQFSLNVGISTHKERLEETILSVIEGTDFSLVEIAPATHEMPLIEEDGWHQWSCSISSIPADAQFKDLLSLRDRISQAAFLPLEAITTPYLALRMIQLGQASVLLGCKESEWLESKSSAYELKNIGETLWKHELAQDVAQFANTEGGGLLVVGFHTKRIAGVDTIDKITPVPTSTTRVQTYKDVLHKRIHPPVSRLIVEAFPWAGRQIICILVPPQRPENQPYLISGSIVGMRYISSGITIVRRQGDASIPVTAQEIHSTLVAGRAFLRGQLDKRVE